ncbi:bifunctional UDP-N-acetylglucosamine diphosphorylase/glucosamine-1-phosphate N-acetyltransferase GlmU [Thermotoga profunda]|uniref:bifunctional UDP-N-acetylglucosamine diphosphorylase/glucosamine-1-phosphate N-acetyltransferase GlmU n=1 Tax=Thermotoga profunda TaxID=1508420 RepID=UPI0005977CEC|nr:bifunctional UDP-N-acetylglucosamine diphosphorylase/glucosamine-1-phosphate N-acetyltransferase GlmU [Thermotoga profunda]
MVSLILAAGMSSRMKSKYPKVTHRLCGKPMIQWVLDAVFGVADKVCVVVGHQAEMVKQVLPDNVDVAYQAEQLGTAHAVMSAKNFINPTDDVLILYGDMPLIRQETLQKIIRAHHSGDYDVTIVSVDMADPTGYGRIIKDDAGEFVKIVEEFDASEEEKKIREINTGVYVFKGEKLLEVLPKVKHENRKNEYYLTDAVGLLEKVNVYKDSNAEDFSGVNNRIQLAEVERILRRRILEKLMLEGVTIIDPLSTYIDANVKIGRDTVIYPMSFLEGETSVGEDCVIGPMTRIVNCVIEDRVTVTRSECVGAHIMCDVSVGPFSRLREGTVLYPKVKIGNFVEVKNSKIGPNTKAQHLTYLGDSQIGENVNVGAGTITCNFDGKKKNQTVIEDQVFIGSNTALVAPVRIKKGAFVAAGSTITQDVPEWSLAIARARQENKPDWVLKKKQKEEG